MPTRILKAITLILLSLAVPALGQQTPPNVFGVPGFEIERVSWVGTVSDGLGVTVLNRYGEVRARFGGYKGQVEVLANVQHFADEGGRLVVEANESATGIEVTVGYRAAEGSELMTTPDPAHRKRADMVVYVPLGAPLWVSTDDGLVDVRGLKSDVRARTRSGRITARKVVGELDFETGSGDALVVLDKWDTVREHSLASETGELAVVFGGEVNAVIRAATSGLISTDFSMMVDYQADRRPVRQSEALLGKGRSLVAISSAGGDIRLSGRPLAREAREQPGSDVEQ